jgi:ubiquinone/menaquinone biosynthesis C-methylase UbiE
MWATFNELDAATCDRLAGVLETRGADAQQQRMRRDFLDRVDFPARAHVLEVGCGTGVLTRVLGRWPGVDTVTGVDLAPALLDKARALAGDLPNVSFQQGDARSLPFQNDSFDVLIYDSTLSHVAGPERAVAEAFRVLRPSGVLAVFDGNYSTTTVALAESDPLQACVDAMMANSVTDRWLMRRLPSIVRACGFELAHVGSHGYVETLDAGYMLTVVDRGADILSHSVTSATTWRMP